VQPSFLTQPGDDRDGTANSIVGPVSPRLGDCLVAMASLVKRTSDWGDPRIAPGLHLHPDANLSGGVERGVDGADPSLRVFLLIDVRDKRQQQRIPLGKVQIQRLA
jgi:hypothetical protein